MFRSAGSRIGLGALNPRVLAAAPTYFYSGTSTARSYDPGVSSVALDSCSITIPAANYARTFKVRASWVGTTGFSSSHGVRNAISVDGVIGTATRGWSVSISGENPYMNLGPQIVVIPGDGVAHTIALAVADSGATGNLTFQQRWITAHQMDPQ